MPYLLLFLPYFHKSELSIKNEIQKIYDSYIRNNSSIAVYLINQIIWGSRASLQKERSALTDKETIK